MSQCKPNKPPGWDTRGTYFLNGEFITREEYIELFGRDPHRGRDPYTLWLLSQRELPEDGPLDSPLPEIADDIVGD